MNRGNTAAQENDAAGEQLQQTALAVYGSEEQSADAALNSSGRAFARALRRAHLNIVLSARAAAAEKRRLLAGKLPANVLGQLAAAGISRAGLRSASTTAFAHLQVGALRLTTSLATPIPSSNLPPEDMAIDPSQLADLIQGLQKAGALTSAKVQTLNNDITSYAASPTAADQAQALASLKSDSRPLSGAVGTFVTTAVGELE
jgi:hypothetical protein